MVAQIRTYTINKGMMDSWLELFDKGIRPIHESLGIPIVATYVNADRTDFIWVRTFETVEELRLALLDFRRRYNGEWMIERHGYRTPAQVRAKKLGPILQAA